MMPSQYVYKEAQLELMSSGLRQTLFGTSRDINKYHHPSRISLLCNLIITPN